MREKVSFNIRTSNRMKRIDIKVWNGMKRKMTTTKGKGKAAVHKMGTIR